MSDNKPFLQVRSEIGKLKAVMLHRPGKELERITPQYLHELLFDDIPWLKKMRNEHDGFADALRTNGCTVYYYEEMLEEILRDDKIKEQLVAEVLEKSNIANPDLEAQIKEFLMKKTSSEVAEILIAGLHKKDFQETIRDKRLVDYIKEEYPFYINPLPNLYFTRDPGAVIGNGLCINSMNTFARERETMILKYIYTFHSTFKKEVTPLWYDYHKKYSLEGGDILVLGENVVAIGCSERTSARGIEDVAANLFSQDEKVRQVLAVQIPFTRAYMHLDTVFTMVDHDKFTIYPGVEEKLRVFRLSPGKTHPKVEVLPDLQSALKETLNLSAIDLIQSGGGDEVTAAREQWNDSTNTLAIAPGVVITYDRNEASNETLRKHGIKVIEIEGSELVRGRGGPRCMSMPLVREDL
ncbi:arginine deiminase [Geosporobacter ferrireducens]|uniref:arginine deiminase n=1 Tax=Geosporobacter ferrireducens TaxID=1424294 RepID=UPI00139D8F8A|nr:arginine deiminase [Geosporobacter ferrireducens]MTI53259.1 arginine deiminase [Geosporobacter ferrireducens]